MAFRPPVARPLPHPGLQNPTNAQPPLSYLLLATGGNLILATSGDLALEKR